MSFNSTVMIVTLFLVVSTILIILFITKPRIKPIKIRKKSINQLIISISGTIGLITGLIFENSVVFLLGLIFFIIGLIIIFK